MGRNQTRRTVLKGLGAAGLVGVAGCVGDDADDADDTDDTTDDVSADLGDTPVEFGVLMPETGDLGSLGPPIRDGALLVEEQLNDELDDIDISVSTGDTQTDPPAGISEANSLVDAGIPAIVGAAASNVTNQVIREATIPNEVVTISPASTDPGITEVDDDGYNFRTAPSDALQGPVIAQVADEQLDAGTVSTLFLNDDYGQALEEAFVTGFEEEHGGEAIERVSFEPEQPSYSTVLDEAMGADPDFLWIVGFPESGIQLFRDFYSNYDDDFPIIVPDGLIDDGLPSEVGNDMNNVWGTAPATAGPGSDRFTELYQETWDADPGPFNAQAYDAAAVVVLATLAAGEADGTAIRDAIPDVTNPGGEEIDANNLAEGCELAADGEEIEYAGASSPVVFDDNGDMEAVSYDVLRFQDGDIEEQDVLDFE